MIMGRLERKTCPFCGEWLIRSYPGDYSRSDICESCQIDMDDEYWLEMLKLPRREWLDFVVAHQGFFSIAEKIENGH